MDSKNMNRFKSKKKDNGDKSKKVSKSKSNDMYNTQETENDKKSKMDEEAEEVEDLIVRCEKEAPARGSILPMTGGEEREEVLFRKFPISSKTLTSLSLCNFHYCTSVQHATLPHALNNRDILGGSTYR